MNKTLKVLALLFTQTLISCGGVTTSSGEFPELSPSVPAGDLSAEAFFTYGNFLEYYFTGTTVVESVTDETLASLGMTSHSEKTTHLYTSDILEALGTEDQTFEDYPSVYLDIKEQKYIRDGYIHFIHDEGDPDYNYRISVEYNDTNFALAYYIGMPKAHYIYFENFGTHYTFNELLRSGVTTDDGVSLYISYVTQETSETYGYKLDIQMDINNNKAVSSIITEHFYEDEAVVYSSVTESTYTQAPREEYPWIVDLLDYTQYPEQNS